ncbi:glycosyltransferase family 4 protein [Acinetobacter sp. ANC 4282]|uniref:glycosyltransferase family 4 protein n=1 Tax=Acinetobacter terrae TaxID=2731247 RepID=UPI00148FB3F8|nr:glycosyltransferase family 4 protein [Acinetobacter terrae]NNH16646.1 glycosyltransferase family 4 protein [Acinetobacter terrae]
MKLLYFIPNLSTAGGMERVLTKKVNYLAKTGNYNIFIITTDMNEWEAPFFELDDSIKVFKFKLFFNELYGLNIFLKTLETYRLLRKYREMLEFFLNKEKIDFCISMGGKELEFLYKISYPVKKIYEAHFSYGIRTRNLLQNKSNSIFWKIIGIIREKQSLVQTKSLDKVVVLTEKSRVDWSKTNNNVVVIPNPSSISTSNCDYKYNPNSKRVIAVGRLEYEKGFDLLINAWVEVNKKHSDWKLDIYGEGTLRKELQELININNLNDNVNLCGLTNNVALELSKSAFYVLSSRYEGLPMVMLESLTCGIPMVAFDCDTGPRDIIENSDCGFLARNEDVADLSKQIIKMINLGCKRFNLSQNCKNKSQLYSIDRVINIWVSLFNSL